jgi:hypothetical protein
MPPHLTCTALHIHPARWSIACMLAASMRTPRHGHRTACSARRWACECRVRSGELHTSRRTARSLLLHCRPLPNALGERAAIFRPRSEQSLASRPPRSLFNSPSQPSACSQRPNGRSPHAMLAARVCLEPDEGKTCAGSSGAYVPGHDGTGIRVRGAGPRLVALLASHAAGVHFKRRCSIRSRAGTRLTARLARMCARAMPFAWMRPL